MGRKHWLVSLVIFIVVIGGFVYFSQHPPAPVNTQGAQQGSSLTSVPIGQRTKTAGCSVNGVLQDTACTPGAIITTATKEQICVPGYSKTVRNVPTAEKDQVYAEYGITSHSPGQYEVDHLISLELGGSNDISNLWPEAAATSPGFHQKDGEENTLHTAVCNGSISLQQAQQEIAQNWASVYGSSH
jgi:hypothetical protein